jgi:nicotinic acetylcholine receptor, invertebrate
VFVQLADCNEDAKRLLDDLLVNYNSVIRPVLNPEDIISLSIGLKLSQIADIVIAN